MNKKKALVCTIIFSIVMFGTYLAMVFVNPQGREFRLIEIFYPIIAGHWMGERIGLFYNWLIKDN